MEAQIQFEYKFFIKINEHEWVLDQNYWKLVVSGPELMKINGFRTKINGN